MKSNCPERTASIQWAIFGIETQILSCFQKSYVNSECRAIGEKIHLTRPAQYLLYKGFNPLTAGSAYYTQLHIHVMQRINTLLAELLTCIFHSFEAGIVNAIPSFK